MGCGGLNYCPNNFVTRAQMALFMSRLGRALTPRINQYEETPGPLDLDSEHRVCTIGEFVGVPHPQWVVVTAMFSGLTNGALNARADIFYSTDGGMNWDALAGQFNRVGAPSGGVWVNTTLAKMRLLTAEQPIWFALVVRRSDVNGGMGNFTNSTCSILVQIFNRNGTSSPF